MSDPIRDYLDTVLARALAATPGPWEAHDGGIISAMTGRGGCGGCSGLPSPVHEPSCYWSDIAGASEPDAEFIALMREAGPRMAAALTAVLDRCDDYERVFDVMGSNMAASEAHVARRIREVVTEALGVEP